MTRTLLFATALIAPALASAQVMPGYPAPSAPQAPVSLDPSQTGTQAPPVRAPAAPAEAPKAAPVVIVKPDGTVVPATPPDPSAATPGNYIYGSTPPPSAEPAPAHAGPVPELHTVRDGDTLWGISTSYFNDPWQWPKVWSYNPQITNPHWIYPGDLVRLLPRGVFGPAQDIAQPEKGGDVGKPAERVAAPAKRLDLALKQTAFVETGALNSAMTIDGATDEKTLLGAGDSVYLAYPSDAPPRVGQRYSIYVPGQTVKSDGKDIGAWVRLLGTLEVVSVKQDKRARGVITESNHEIERGAKVGPLLRQFSNVPSARPKVDARGSIVAMLAHDQLIGQGEVVFVNLGKDSGLEVGNRMFVVRRGDALPTNARDMAGQDDSRFPARALGEVVIVEVGEKISIGLVTLSVQEMGVGDSVMMQAEK